MQCEMCGKDIDNLNTRYVDGLCSACRENRGTVTIEEFLDFLSENKEWRKR